MIYEIFHWTEYRYSESISLSEHALHLLPRDLPGQRVLSASLEFAPEPTALQEHRDYFGNRITSFIIAQPHIGMHIKSRSRIDCDERSSTPPECPSSLAVRHGRLRDGRVRSGGLGVPLPIALRALPR